jgi:hypothetical protein
LTYRYVRTDSTPGGDGTENRTDGVHRAYGSLNEAEADALYGTTLTAPSTITCEGNAADATAVTFAGATTSAANYILVTTDPLATYGRHAGKWSASKYRIEATPSGYGTILIGEPYVWLNGLQIKAVSAPQYSAAIYDNHSGGYASKWVKISNCIVTKTGTNTDTRGILVSLQDAPAVSYVWNCISYDNANASCVGINITTASTAVYLYNNTVQNCTTGISTSSGSAIAVNTLISGCTAAGSGTWAAGTDYNATNLSSMGYTVTGGGNAHDRLSQTFTFVNEAGDDFHLGATDAGARDYGASDPGSGLFSDDIDGVTRSGSWDIGADEYVAAAAGNIAGFLMDSGPLKRLAGGSLAR